MQRGPHDVLAVATADVSNSGDESFFKSGRRQAEQDSTKAIRAFDFFAIEKEMQDIADDMQSSLNKKLDKVKLQLDQQNANINKSIADKVAKNSEKKLLLAREKQLTDEINELKISIKNLEFILQGKLGENVNDPDSCMDVNSLCDNFIIESDLNVLRVKHDKKSAKDKQLYTQLALKTNLDDVQSSHNQFTKLKTEIEDEIKSLDAKFKKIENDTLKITKDIENKKNEIDDNKIKLKNFQEDVIKCEKLVKDQEANKEKSNQEYDVQVASICKTHEDDYEKTLKDYEDKIKKANDKYEKKSNDSKWYRDENIAKKNTNIGNMKAKISSLENLIEEMCKFPRRFPPPTELYNKKCINRSGVEACKQDIKSYEQEIKNIRDDCLKYIDDIGVSRNKSVKNTQQKISNLKDGKDEAIKQSLKAAQDSHEKIKCEIDNKIKLCELDLKNARNSVSDTENKINIGNVSIVASANIIIKNEAEKTSINNLLKNKNQILTKIQEKMKNCQLKIDLIKKESSEKNVIDSVITGGDDYLEFDEKITTETLNELNGKRKRLGLDEQELYTLKLKIKKLICPQDNESEIPLITAVLNGKEDMVRQLLSLGADPNQKDLFGWSALHCAVAKLHPMNRKVYEIIINELLAYNASLTDTNGEGLNAREISMFEDIDNILVTTSTYSIK